MEKKHLIMGTAGHVDHGKTSLIKALTGFDCDTHKQEKQRGITINLGFTHLDLPDGNSIGIIDVPGHVDFIKNMVAGACGIDFVLLIIAADEGIMPQTVEHLEIMKILGIKNGITVLTKIDMVAEDLIELAKEEIKDFLKDSFLENSPVIEVSSVTKQGTDELKKAICDIIPEITEKKSEGIFRMFIDRIFTQPGFGTIVNGSVLSGSISKEDPIYLLPGKKELRIRKLERHGKEVNRLNAGDRGALNIAGLKIKDFAKGMLLAGISIEETNLIDVEITLFKNEVCLGLWSQVIFLSGTIRKMARIHLLDKNTLESGETGLVQIYLPDPVVAQYGDPFIIRNSSGNITLGGGKVIDPYPLHHRRRREKQIEIVKKMSKGNLNELIAAEVRKSVFPVSFQKIAIHLNLSPEDLIETIFQDLPVDITFFQEKNDILLIEKKFKTSLQNKILNKLIEHHKKNPLLKFGNTFNELMGIFGEQQNEETKKALKLILDELRENNKIKPVDRTWALYQHDVKLDGKTKQLIELIDQFLLQQDTLFAELSDILFFLQEKDFKEKEINQTLLYLTKNNKIYLIHKKYIHNRHILKFKDLLVEYLKTNSEGITVAQFRDMIKSNRASAMMILEYFDNQGITLRKGNNRFLTKKFIESLK